MSARVVFDLDGTLVDSVADLTAAVNQMLTDEGVDPLPLATVKRFVGNGLPKLVERVMVHRGLPSQKHPELSRATLTHYNAAPTQRTTVYPGVTKALSRLGNMGCALGVCTNKPEAPARHILEALELLPHFDSVVGGDTVNKCKPDPEHLNACFKAMPNIGPSIFVGDSEVDAETAKRADVPFLLFTEGYRKSSIAELPHLLAFDHYADMPDLLSQIIKEGNFNP
ncbi:phosphoglycolate phosphatase [Ruegeria arenilitoris]|uniref:phosphoglycolate phosphatase n=1 Tax=Ruegeria arenilitoris TaxID=1173585 RepID=UPI001479FF9A|nr:phosphoglycolate phosphatase [Ruegeria arenilitoris]